MRKIKEILRLKWEAGLSARQIAHSLAISHSTVLDMLRRAERAGFTWPLPDIDDATLEAKLYPGLVRKECEPLQTQVSLWSRTRTLPSAAVVKVNENSC